MKFVWSGYPDDIGRKYFVRFTDDYTHVSVVYLIRAKNEVFQCLQKYEALAD